MVIEAPGNPRHAAVPVSRATLGTPEASRVRPRPAPPPRQGEDRGELAWATVDLGAIAANTRWLASRAAPAGLMAVVKANGFGHGLVPVATTALGAGATWLGVARLGEGLALRTAGLTAPILAWLPDPAWLGPAIRAAIDVSASSTDDLERIAAASSRQCRPQVHLKLDTGLHRAGATADAWPSVVDAAAHLERRGRIHVRGVWSHLSHGDVLGDPQNAGQQAALTEGVEVARAHGLAPELTHLANTGGVQQLGAAGCSMARVGAGLYGIDPLAGEAGGERLRAAMTLSTRVIGVRQVAAGEGVGYGHAWRAPRQTRLALVPLGYADGIPRSAGGRAQILVAGTRVPVVGRVSMDQAVLDVGDLRVRQDDPVTVFSDGSDGAPTLLDWAAWAGTIPHEILTGIGPRVVRHLVGDAR